MPASVRAAWHRDAGHALASAGAAPDRVARQLLRALGGPVIRVRGPSDGRNGADGEGFAALRMSGVAADAHDASMLTSPGAPTAAQRDRPVTRRNRPGPRSWREHGHRDRASAGRPRLDLVVRSGGRLDDGLADHARPTPWSARHPRWRRSCSPRRSAASRPGPPGMAGWPAGSPTRSTAPATGRRPCRWRSGRSATPPIPTWSWTCTGRSPSAGCWPARSTESLTTLDRALAAPGLSAKHRARLLVLAARTYQFLGDLEAADREAERRARLGRGSGRRLGDGLGAARARARRPRSVATWPTRCRSTTGVSP